MKRICLLISGLLIITFSFSQQNTTGTGKIYSDSSSTIFKAGLDHEFDTSSNVSNIYLTKRNINDLATLGQIWGFLKYYHPAVAKGEYNWDYELFRVLPSLFNAKSRKDRRNIMNSWISGLGTYDVRENSIVEAGEIKMLPDISWIKERKLGSDLVATLNSIRTAKRTEDHYYIKPIADKTKFELTHESPYENMVYPDKGYRLLSLYRYWNIINYYFPYKYLIDEDWNKVLVEYIPKFLNANNDIEYKLAVLSLINRIHDTHANIWGFDFAFEYYKGLNWIPFKITFVENKAVVSDIHPLFSNPSSKIKIGDVIEVIDGKTVENIIKERIDLTPGSNYPTKLRDLAKELLRTQNSTMEIQYSNDHAKFSEKLQTIQMTHINPHTAFQKKDTCFKMITPEIAYLYPGTVKNEYLPIIMAEVLDTKGLIIDFRCYPSANIYFTLNEYLLPEEKSFAKLSKGSITLPGLFTMTPEVKAGKTNPDYYKGKVIILINEETQSSAEYTTMALRIAPKAKVIGSTTAAADGDISWFFLPGGIKTAISGKGVYYPDGSETQRIGIVPDIEVKPTIKGIKEGRDELLEKAVEIILMN